MSGEMSADYKSGSQRARAVMESWAEHNLYCPNCSSPKLNRLSHNTRASDFSCPRCKFWFQLKGQQKPIGTSIPDGPYKTMMQAIQGDDAPSFYFMHYDLAACRIKNLLLVPYFAFPPSALIKRPAVSAAARSAGRAGCDFALDRIPPDARILIVTTFKPPHKGDTECIMISPPEQVRKQFKQIKLLKELSVAQRGWTLDVLNIVRRLHKEEFSNSEVYAFERELEQLHPDNRRIRDKILQQLQVLRDTGLLSQPERGVWRVK